MKALVNGCKTLCILVFLLLQGCVSNPVYFGNVHNIGQEHYDMEKPKMVSASASGFQLLLFIPININDRHERAFNEIKYQAGDGLIGNIQVKESWTYGFVGTQYTTTIVADVYPRKPQSIAAN